MYQSQLKNNAFGKIYRNKKKQEKLMCLLFTIYIYECFEIN